jgi:hypothetical protein
MLLEYHNYIQKLFTLYNQGASGLFLYYRIIVVHKVVRNRSLSQG